MTLAVAIVAVAAVFLGFGIGAQVARTRGAKLIEAARAERDAAMSDREQLRADLIASGTERDHALAERAELRAERDAALKRAGQAEQQLAATGARLQALAEAESQIKDTFARITSEALDTNRQQLLEVADAQFRQAGQPLTETLSKVESQLREIERNRASAQAVLTDQIKSVRLTGDQLRAETSALVNALRKPQARGQWGELTLRRCLEHAGMLDRCDFVEQGSISTSEGVLRPDLVIKLVGDKNIVVDAKVTLAAFLEAHEATDDTLREDRLAAHAKHLRQHVDSLAGKAYWEHLSPAPEFVVLFVPGDAFLAAALDRDATLLEDAFRKRVHIATPTTLISVLRTVAYAWQQQALADNAREVFDLGRELYKRLGTMGGHVDRLGRSLTSAVDHYNKTVGSLESQVMSTARKLNDMNVTDEPLKELAGIEDTIRPLAKAELVASAEEASALVAVSGLDDARRIEDYGINVRNEAERDRRTGS
ncbi:MAG TPA: DNA recombination protein RmuC [Mycobacteriales bacterium]|nr:DNA recombination protein RmuC [Mycobacteriales bacterium]